jgi:hypothetical protein
MLCPDFSQIRSWFIGGCASRIVATSARKTWRLGTLAILTAGKIRRLPDSFTQRSAFDTATSPTSLHRSSPLLIVNLNVVAHWCK